MYKILLTILMASLSLGLTGQVLEFKNGNDQIFWAPSSDYKDIHVPFSNKSGKTTTIHYAKVWVDYPITWDVSFCDDHNCFTNFVQLDSFLAVGNNAETEFKISVFPNGYSDTAYLKYVIYIPGNEASRDTVSIQINVPWAVGTDNIAAISDLKLYPNPAGNSVAFDSKLAGHCEILDAKGSVVLATAATSGNNVLDISLLQSGFYYFRMTTAEGVLRKEFVKQ